MSQTSSSKFLAYRPQAGFRHHIAFTTVDAGNMSTTVLDASETGAHPTENRRRMERNLGIEPGTTRFVSQIHSNKVVDASADGWAADAALVEADALVSVTGREPLGILVADCLPVAFTTDYGPSAIAHAGRVGLLGGILENTVERLREVDGADRGRIHAVIGPSICGQCYEVPAEMQEHATKRYPEIASETSWGTPALDLPAAAESVLAGLQVDILRSHECTYTSQQYYSHRRQPGRGRIAAYVWQG